MVASDFVSQRMIYRFFSDWCCFLFKLQLRILCQFLPLSQPHPAMNQKCTVSFFGHRSGCNCLLLLFVIRLVMLYGTWSGALSLIWKCKLVTRAIAQVLRAVPRHEHVWPVLHHPCWSLVRFQTELMELVMIYKSHKYSETCYLRKIIFPSELWHYG